jgi:Zn-dependent protease
MTYAAQPPANGLRLFGVGINIDPTWLIFAVFIGSQFWGDVRPLGMTSALIVAVLMVFGLSLSILLHEMAHTLTGRAFGMRIDRITLHVFGGIAELHEEPKTAISELLMAAAGPLLSVGLYFLLNAMVAPLTLAHAPAELTLATGYLADLNLVLAIFNMVPAYPMDGGRVLRSLIWLFTGRLGLATRIAATLGQGFGVLLMVWGGYVALFQSDIFAGLWRIVLGAMLMRMAKFGYRSAPKD